MIVSALHFRWFCTFMVAGICIFWAVWDGRLLMSLWKERKQRHDEFFGALMGLVMCAVGLIGLYRHYQTL